MKKKEEGKEEIKKEIHFVKEQGTDAGGKKNKKTTGKSMKQIDDCRVVKLKEGAEHKPVSGKQRKVEFRGINDPCHSNTESSEEKKTRKKNERKYEDLTEEENESSNETRSDILPHKKTIKREEQTQEDKNKGQVKEKRNQISEKLKKIKKQEDGEKEFIPHKEIDAEVETDAQPTGTSEETPASEEPGELTETQKATASIFNFDEMLDLTDVINEDHTHPDPLDFLLASPERPSFFEEETAQPKQPEPTQPATPNDPLQFPLVPDLHTMNPTQEEETSEPVGEFTTIPLQFYAPTDFAQTNQTNATNATIDHTALSANMAYMSSQFSNLVQVVNEQKEKSQKKPTKNITSFISQEWAMEVKTRKTQFDDAMRFMERMHQGMVQSHAYTGSKLREAIDKITVLADRFLDYEYNNPRFTRRAPHTDRGRQRSQSTAPRRNHYSDR